MLSAEGINKANRYNLRQLNDGKLGGLPEMFTVWLYKDVNIPDDMGAFTWSILLFQIPQPDLVNDGMCGPNTRAKIRFFFGHEDQNGVEYPLSGKGFWLWRDYQLVPEARGHDSGPVLEAALHKKAEEYVSGGITHVLLKVAEDCYALNESFWELLPGIFGQYGIKVVPWVYVWNYSDRDLSNFRSHAPDYDKSLGSVSTWWGAMSRQARMHQEILDKVGGDFLIINAEKGVKYLRARGGKTDPDPRKQKVSTYKDQIHQYLTDLRKAEIKLAVSTYGLPDNQVRHLPLVEMMEVVHWGMPQWYWDVKGRTPKEMVEDGVAEWRKYTDKPLIPSGGCWQERRDDGSWTHHWHTDSEVIEFLNLMKSRNCPWVTFWREVGDIESNNRMLKSTRHAIYDYSW